MENSNLKVLIRYSVLIALTTVMTMVIKIPTVATKGYLNLGDMVVFIAALTMGKKAGLIVGGVGSAMADLLLGYTHYVPITLVVKGLEGYIAGRILETSIGEKWPIIATATGGIFMALGYFIPQIFMYGKGGAIASLPGNIAQGLFGAITAVVLYKALRKTQSLKQK